MEATRFHMTIFGAPRTKKNSQRLVKVKGRWLPLPSKPYARWLKAAIPQARVQWFPICHEPLRRPCAIVATFYRARRTGDLNNFFAALADMLQEAGVVEDDKFITCWDGSKLDADPKRPRIELLITPLEA